MRKLFLIFMIYMTTFPCVEGSELDLFEIDEFVTLEFPRDYTVIDTLDNTISVYLHETDLQNLSIIKQVHKGGVGVFKNGKDYDGFMNGFLKNFPNPIINKDTTLIIKGFACRLVSLEFNLLEEIMAVDMLAIVFGKNAYVINSSYNTVDSLNLKIPFNQIVNSVQLNTVEIERYLNEIERHKTNNRFEALGEFVGYIIIFIIIMVFVVKSRYEKLKKEKSTILDIDEFGDV